MSDYKEIQGYSIEVRSGNPSPLVVGHIFYDSSTGTLKIVVDVSGTPTVKTISVS